jgi:hypothetical protein
MDTPFNLDPVVPRTGWLRHVVSAISVLLLLSFDDAVKLATPSRSVVR